jgi:hypothetical protein
MAPLVDRTEFRKVVKQMVGCLHENLDRPGLAPLTPEQIVFWMQNITLEDIQVVAAELEADGKK